MEELQAKLELYNATQYAWKLAGVNSNAIKGNLKRLGYFYKTTVSYRDKLFVEKVHPTTGSTKIIVMAPDALYGH